MKETRHSANRSTDSRLANAGWSRRSVLAAGLTAGVTPFVPWQDAGAVPALPNLIVRGMSLPSWQYHTYRCRRYAESLIRLADMGFTAVAITPGHTLASASDCRVVASSGNEGFDDLAFAVEQARKVGLGVLLKPRLTVFDCSLSAGAIDPTDTAAFFADYRRLLLRYAALAHRCGASMLAIGCELANLSGPAHRESWLRLIDHTRQAFSGPLVYAATCGEALQLSFWDALDYIGVEMLTPVRPTEPTSADAVLARWLQAPSVASATGADDHGTHAATWRSLARRHRKPILLTEAGVRRIAGSSDGPVSGDIAYAAADFALDAGFYQALIREASEVNDGWLAGMFLSGWRIDAAPRSQTWTI